MSSYADFVQFVKNDGLARQNRFSVTFALPALSGPTSGIFSAAGQNMRSLSLMCKSVSVPGINIVTAPYRIIGETFEVPYDRSFSGATLSFYMDKNMYFRQFFDDWINTIQDKETRNLGYYKEIVSPEMTIDVLDRMNNINYTIILKDVFPKTIGALELDQGSNDTMVLPVTFDYHYYETKLTSAAIESGLYGQPTTFKYTTGTGSPYLIPQAANGTLSQTGLPSSLSSVNSAVGNFTTDANAAVSQVMNTVGLIQQNTQAGMGAGMGAIGSLSQSVSSVAGDAMGAVTGAGQTVSALMGSVSAGINNAQSQINQVLQPVNDARAAVESVRFQANGVQTQIRAVTQTVQAALSNPFRFL